MGALKIEQLRAIAETNLGSKFDLRQFHDVVLENGALPLDILGSKVKTWIQSVG